MNFIGRLGCEQCTFTTETKVGLSVHKTRSHQNKLVITIEDYLKRFLDKIIIDKNGCWVWIGAKRRRNYGCMKIFGKMVPSHRFIYEYYNNEIDPNLTIDHLCRNTSCANPTHLEQVTIQENIQRGNGISVINSKKTHCNNGHPFSCFDNLRILSNGERRCKICERIRSRLYQQRRKKHE